MSPTGVHCQRHGWTHVSDLSKETLVTTPTEVTTPTDHRPELVTVIAHMRAKPGKEQDLRDALEARGSTW
jgi:hypothetical protein